MIEIPKRMRTLERDRRGYPIPFIVLRDAKRMAHFNVNDIRRVLRCVARRLCSICGRPIDGLSWFVGGTPCFTSPRGAFLDPPMHQECAEYALQVCPFLAMPHYSKSIGMGRLKATDVPCHMVLQTVEYDGPMRPERFGIGACMGFHVHKGPQPGQLVFVPTDWQMVEFWRHGEPVEAPDKATVDRLESIEA